MKHAIQYTDESLGNLVAVRDFLPPPEELVLKEDNLKITLALSKRSVDFFKLEAKRNHTQYQKMIRRLIDVYVDSHAGKDHQSNA